MLGGSWQGALGSTEATASYPLYLRDQQNVVFVAVVKNFLSMPCSTKIGVQVSYAALAVTQRFSVALVYIAKKHGIS